MKELLDGLDEHEAVDMLHYRTLFDEDSDFSQVNTSCHGRQALPCVVTIPALSSAGQRPNYHEDTEVPKVCKSCLSSQEEALSCLVAVPALSRPGQGPSRGGLCRPMCCLLDVTQLQVYTEKQLLSSTKLTVYCIC